MSKINFIEFCEVLESLEIITSRNVITEKIANLLLSCDIDEVYAATFLLIGELGPSYIDKEIQIADKLVIEALSLISNSPKTDVELRYSTLGDLGLVAYEIASNHSNMKHTSITQVFETLHKIASFSGTGSKNQKVSLLSQMLSRSSPVEAKFIVRFVLGRMRLGFTTLTIIDALSYALKGDKSLKISLLGYYNVRTDLGFLAAKVLRSGDGFLKDISPEIGTPIRPQLTERLPDAETIISKMISVAVEPKYDGYRVQVHYSSKMKEKQGEQTFFEGAEMGYLKVYSRNGEDISMQFPEIVSDLQSLGVDDVILDGEVIAYDQITQDFLPFQQTIQRRRKHSIDSVSKQIPIKLFSFDVLYLNGESLLEETFIKRRKILSELLMRTETIVLCEQTVLSDSKQLQALFEEYVSRGLEGVIAKKLDSLYTAGARNMNWVKLKRSIKGHLKDSLDLVVLGYYLGKGKRTNFGIGAFLVGTYDIQADKYVTLGRVGTGVKDDQWQVLKTLFDQNTILTQPENYHIPSKMAPDCYILPKIVVEIMADELTLSPTHTAMSGEKNLGLALRFPRLVALREDKFVEDITTLDQVQKLYQMQKI